MYPESESTFEERVVPYVVGGAILSTIAAGAFVFLKTYQYGWRTAAVSTFCAVCMGPAGGAGLGVLAKFGQEKVASFRQQVKTRR